MKVKGFNHVTVAVSDLTRALSFYQEKLQMKLVHLGNTDAYLEWGDAWFCLLEKQGRPENPNNTFGVDHVAFTIEEKDFENAVQQLKNSGISIVKGPAKRGTGMSVYFTDPDGTLLELHTSNLHERMRVWK